MLFVALDAKGVISALDNLAEGTNRAVVRALNRAIKSARTVETREISADTGLKQKDVRDALTLRTANGGTASASLSASLKKLPLIKFGAKGPRPSRGKGSGVTYKLQGGRDRLPSAFIATMANGHEGVFMRTPGRYMKTQKSTWKRKREAIQEKFGVSIGHVFIKFQPQAIARANESFLTSFQYETTFGGPPVPQGLEASDADPNEFTALANMRNALRAMSVDGGYHYDVAALAVKLDPNQGIEDLITPDGPRPFVVLEVQPDEWQYRPAGLVEITVPVTVHWVSDSVPTDDESLMRTFYQGCADVEKALAAAITLGGTVGAFDIRIVQRQNTRAVDGSLVWAQIGTRLLLQRTYGQA